MADMPGISTIRDVISENMASVEGNSVKRTKKRRRKYRKTQLSLYRARKKKVCTPSRFSTESVVLSTDNLNCAPRKRKRSICFNGVKRTKLLFKNDTGQPSVQEEELADTENVASDSVSEASDTELCEVPSSMPNTADHDGSFGSDTCESSGKIDFIMELGGSITVDKEDLAAVSKELTNIIPSIVDKLLKAGILHEYVMFHRLVAEDIYPLDNVSLLLWLETVRWYSQSSTSTMRYWPQTMQFWDTGYSLFHGKFLRLLSGPKSLGQVVSGELERGMFNPVGSQINFAVPDPKMIRRYTCTVGDNSMDHKPGISDQALEFIAKAKPGVPHILSVDGKKVASGLSENSGDVDLFGYEDGDKLADRTARIQSELEHVEYLLGIFQKYGTIGNVPTPIPVVHRIKDLIKTISKRLKDLRELQVKQEMGLRKFMGLGGEDWRQSKYVFAISSIQCQIYRIKLTIQQALDCNLTLTSLGSSLFGTDDLITDGSEVQLSQLKNFVSLKDVDYLPSDIQACPQFIKQRSEQWFEIRKKYPVTGSTLQKACGLDTVKAMQEHFDQKIRHIEPPEPTDEVKRFMKHGTDNENSALATITTRILPLYFPFMSYCEEGVHTMDHDNGKPLFAISPDGSLRYSSPDSVTVAEPLVGVEVKCPFPNQFTTPVHYSLPHRYIPQVLSEMRALNVKELVYASYSSQSTTVFLVKFDDDLWQMLNDSVSDVYATDIPRRPQSISNAVKDIKNNLLKKFCLENVEFLAEVPSVTVTNTPNQLVISCSSTPWHFAWNSRDPNETNRKAISPTNVLMDAERILKESHQISRLKGTEVVVFMLSDCNRTWHQEIPHSIPVAYGLKGYSLTTDAMRQMVDRVLMECHRNGIKVPCVSFDGQWCSVMTRDVEGKPLTRLQLQKSIWTEAKSTSKTKILSFVRQIGKVTLAEIDISRNEAGRIIIGTKDMLMSTLKTPLKRDVWSKKKKSDKENMATNTTPSIEWLPEDVLDQLQTNDEATDVITSLAPAAVQDFEVDDMDEDYLPDLQTPNLPDTVSIPPTKENHQQRVQLPPIYCQRILDELKGSSQGKRKDLWEKTGENQVTEYLKDSKTLSQLTAGELTSILEITLPLHQKVYRKTWLKGQKVNLLSEIFGDGSKVDPPRKQSTKLQCLKDLAFSVVQKFPKMVLNSIYASAISRPKVAEWTGDEKVKIGNIGYVEWYYRPEYSVEREQHEVKVLDGHHLLVNLRVKVCKDGLRGYTISKDAWHTVAAKSPEVLSEVHVVNLVDKQSGSFARRTFSTDVERVMRENKFNREADFVRLIREWYEAEDEPGISAEERVRRRLALRDFLLSRVDFHQYPPPGAFVNDMSLAMFEGFLCSIDAHIQLYNLFDQPYNQRAVGSQDVENYFSELTDLEPTKLGCPKAINIGRLMSTATKLLKYRCDPSSRVFSMWTTRNPTYPTKAVMLPSSVTGTHIEETTDGATDSTSIQREINLRDHFFDTKERSRTKQCRKKGHISAPDAPSRGVVGVRQHHKFDESKVLPTARLGIQLTDV